jgi:hypothetical protein
MPARGPVRLKPIHLLRYGLPAAITVVGVVLFCIGGSIANAAGITAIGVAVMVVGVNLFARMTIASHRDRDREERARENYARTGRWEDPPAAKVAGPAGLPLARQPPPPVPQPDHHDAGHLKRPGPSASRRGLSEHRRPPRRPD